MNNQKKRIVMLAVLLIALFAFGVSDKNISMLEYVCLFINAALYLALSFTLESRVELQRRLFEKMEDDRRVMMRSFVKLSVHCIDKSVLSERISKVDAMPKVVSATGQVYVDFEEVMRIIRGDEFVER